ncbi:tail fiber assembly protein [Paraburkholderia sp. BR10936]|uniref:tail fiber assembly protein n=1 Tax=Paraburkholderia sp. BR10936 TaxID=3236993 RepID=UPI0034D2450B
MIDIENTDPASLDALAAGIPKVLSYHIFCDDAGKVITFLPAGETIPDALKQYTATEVGEDVHAQVMDLLNGKGVDVQFKEGVVTDLIRPDEYHAAIVRTQRDNKLADTDWLVTRQHEASLTGDSYLSTDELRALVTYRQALRDVPKQKLFPFKIEWPAYPDLSV